VGTKLYVGNLPYSATNDSLTNEFSKHGSVESVKIITDRDTGRSKGFGFVEMSNDTEAQSAIESMNGKEFEGRSITVSEARPQAPRDNNSRGGGSRDRDSRGGGNGGGRNRW
jgi:RNA recognition motif-containing protein